MARSPIHQQPAAPGVSQSGETAGSWSWWRTLSHQHRTHQQHQTTAASAALDANRRLERLALHPKMPGLPSAPAARRRYAQHQLAGAQHVLPGRPCPPRRPWRSVRCLGRVRIGVLDAISEIKPPIEVNGVSGSLPAQHLREPGPPARTAQAGVGARKR
jgi:hypothetical protein